MEQGNDFRRYALSSGISTMKMQYFENYTTPYILEERNLNVTQMDIFSRMMKDRMLWIFGAVNDDMASIVQAQLLYLESISEQDIVINLSSPGGSVIAGNGMCDTMDIIKPDVATICVGMAASMGAVILSNGAKGKRSSLISSRVMVHQASSGAQGHVADNRINHRETEKHNFILMKKIAMNCGKDFKEVYNSANRDKWFNSDEALAFGLIDEVVGIANNPSITEQMSGWEEYYAEVNKE